MRTVLRPEPGHNAACRVYDPSGVLVATIDPTTRERTPVDGRSREKAGELARLRPAPASQAPQEPAQPVQAPAEATPAAEAVDPAALLKDLKGAVRALDPKVGEDTEAFGAALVFLAGFAVGQGVPALAALTGFPKAEVRRWKRRWVRDGIWRGGVGRPLRTLAAPALQQALFEESKEATVTFWLCVLVALDQARYDARTGKWRHTTVAAEA